MTGQRVLFLRIEPTGYMLSLLGAVRQAWPAEVEACFVSKALSQAWEFNSAETQATVLPQSRLRAMRAIREKILRDRPALVHCAGWGTPPCAVAIVTAHAAGIPVVVDLDTWMDAATGLKARIKHALLPRLLRRVTHFAPGGQRQAAFLRGFGIPEDRITPVNMTVDVTAIRSYLDRHPQAGDDFRRRLRLPENARVVLFLGRLVPEKGIDDILDAWGQIALAHPTAHLVFVGDGVLAPKIRAAVSDRVHFPGRLSGDGVWHAYAAADVFVAPARREPWGLTINEAMAAGVPIVMTDAFGCIGDLAISHDTACIVPAENAAGLAEGLNHVLGDPDYANGLRVRASQRIGSWRIEDEAERIAAIWRRCV